MFFKKKAGDGQHGPSEVRRCSFCQKSESDVAKLIAGPSAYICDECVRVCTGLIAGDQVMADRVPAADEGAAPREVERTAFCAFCGRPMEHDEGAPVPGQGAYCPACVADDSTPSA